MHGQNILTVTGNMIVQSLCVYNPNRSAYTGYLKMTVQKLPFFLISKLLFKLLGIYFYQDFCVCKRKLVRSQGRLMDKVHR